MDWAELRLVSLVGAGGAIGSILRYVISGALTKGEFPWGTAAVNIAGSFALALLFFMSLHRGGSISPDAQAFLFIGLIGGFTTMSTFTLETVAQMGDGRWADVALNLLLNLGLCIAGALAGRTVGVWLGTS